MSIFKTSVANMPLPGLSQLREARLLLAGLGNIGSFLAEQLAQIVGAIRLVDRDVVELRNVANQRYGPEHAGLPKVVAVANHLQQIAPHLQIERRVSDIEDLPWGDFTDVHLVVAGLDSLRARQILSERTYTLGIPYIDGAVGDPLLVRVQVLMPGSACLECAFGETHYRQITAETPCLPGDSQTTAATGVPSCAGAAAASLIVAQCLRVLGETAPDESYEIHGDLLHGRVVSGRRRKNPRCRFSHPQPPQRLILDPAFPDATVADLMRTVQRFAGSDCRLEFRRGVLGDSLFGAKRWAAPDDLKPLRRQPLEHLGLTPRDHIVLHTEDHPTAHLCFRSGNPDEPTKPPTMPPTGQPRPSR